MLSRLPPSALGHLPAAKMLGEAQRAAAEGEALAATDPATALATMEIVAEADASAGWCVMIGATAGMAAAWLDETEGGVALRIVSLNTGRILVAENLDGALRSRTRTARTFRVTDDLERRLRGESLTHVAIDIGLLPGQHLSFDVIDQFGDRNLDLAGLSVSVVDPVIGVGAAYYRVIPEAYNLTLGVKALVSLPTAAGNALGFEGALINPLLSGVLVVRWPIPHSGFGVLATASTNGALTLGVSLLNVNFLPVLP
jgi:hypothetical protein